MSAFERSKAQVENEAMVRLLEHVEENPQISQRALSTQVGIAFGLVNTYLKRSVEKGWVRVKNISPKRYAYFVTPQGMVEKTRMVKAYMSHSLSLFREARAQADVFFIEAQRRNYKKIAIVGEGDLAEIIQLVAQAYPFDIHLVSLEGDLKNYDAVFIADMSDPQTLYDRALKVLAAERIFVLEALHIKR
ncbi:MAG: winged helix-turn-helix transcriptional regulator [Alphaproteobacteria bacterium]|nr:winged helix-turn-helix transcriptional regulator [Alphaproteobacteria bacterium]NCQ66280.1 winged helix-turn-helix transcriptional regulator [Alphaproteobacteria bacterium]NCT06628.1 winged helix-turn-helix transcriptional regulator [Alphaproteobacteria bacterium]